MPRLATSNRRETRWTVRVIPFFILGALGYGTYVVVPHLCSMYSFISDVRIYSLTLHLYAVNYLHKQKDKTAVATVLIVLYLIFLVLTLATYLRTILTVLLNPGFVPLTTQRQDAEKHLQETRKRGGDVEQLPWVPPDEDPDSPGLEAFYSKDAFVCELDGRPKWCSECRTWKPDRAHHSSEMGRCIRKMDHLCPWVGGMVSETCKDPRMMVQESHTVLTITSFQFLCPVYLLLRMFVHYSPRHNCIFSSTTESGRTVFGWPGCCGHSTGCIFWVFHPGHVDHCGSLHLHKHH